jgi:hypothetical protein
MSSGVTVKYRVGEKLTSTASVVTDGGTVSAPNIDKRYNIVQHPRSQQVI